MGEEKSLTRKREPRALVQGPLVGTHQGVQRQENHPHRHLTFQKIEHRQRALCPFHQNPAVLVWSLQGRFKQLFLLRLHQAIRRQQVLRRIIAQS